MAIGMATPALLILAFLVMYKIFLILSPSKMKRMLQSQGIPGPNPMFLLGNVMEMRSIIQKAASMEPLATHNLETGFHHNLETGFNPHFVEWRKKYGKLFVYWLGSEPVLHVQEPELIKQISSSASLNWGRPEFFKNDYFPLFGNGIVMAEDQDWIHQRRIVSRAFTSKKVKGMFASVVEASVPVLNEWATKIKEGSETIVEIDMDGALYRITVQVISKFLFGSSYQKGFDVLAKLRLLQQSLPEVARFAGILGSKYIPSAGNKKARKFSKEADSILMQIIKKRFESKSTGKGYGDDFLGILLEQAEANEVTTQDVLDQCKTLLIAGHETTKLSLCWTLLLLCENPEWQRKVRKEVAEITKGELPDISMFSKMKTMNMVLNESMRLYPPVTYTLRQAKTDIQLKDMAIPKGMSVLINILGMHEDPDIWGGEDVFEFNPERFSSGEAAKKNGGFIPFGFGGRTCVGERLARMEQKTILTMILSKFVFTLCPYYVHNPISILSSTPSTGLQILLCLNSVTDYL